MNENKEIKEMAREIQKSVDGCADYWATLIAKHLIEQGYRNCKDKVVLSKEELQELKRYKLDWLNSEKMHLQAELEDTEFELASSNRTLKEVNKENQTLKDRIAELKEYKEKWQRKAINYYKMAKSYGIECIVDNEIDETLRVENQAV